MINTCMTNSVPHALQITTQINHEFVKLYRRGVPNSPRGAPQGARFPQRILLRGSNIARHNLRGGAINRGSQIPYDTGYPHSSADAYMFNKVSIKIHFHL